MKKRKGNEEEKTKKTINLTVGLCEELREAAFRERMSESSIVRKALREYLAKAPKREEKKGANT